MDADVLNLLLDLLPWRLFGYTLLRSILLTSTQHPTGITSISGYFAADIWNNN